MGRVGLGLDAGGSATRWTLCDAAGAVIAAGELAAVSGHLADPAARRRLEEVALDLRRALAGLARPGAVVAGITGLSAGSAEAAVAAAALASALGLPAGSVRVYEDSWIAYHAVFAPGAGHLVYAGTGSIGLHVRADGSVARVGGHLADRRWRVGVLDPPRGPARRVAAARRGPGMGRSRCRARSRPRSAATHGRRCALMCMAPAGAIRWRCWRARWRRPTMRRARSWRAPAANWPGWRWRWRDGKGCGRWP